MAPRRSRPMGDDELPLFVHWERTLADLLDRTMRFPKAARFTFASRVDGLALDVLEGIVEARYARGRRKQDALRRIDLQLAKLRVLVRLCHDRRFLDTGGLEHVARNLDEAGRMIGGWLKQQAGQ